MALAKFKAATLLLLVLRNEVFEGLVSGEGSEQAPVLSKSRQELSCSVSI